MFDGIFNNLKKNPIVHCITNFVTVNDVANIILASGGSPIMAANIEEVSEITNICNSLVINIGDMSSKVESILAAGKTSNELKHPVILDPVAVGASEFRKKTTEKLLKELDFAVIRGNASEIKALAKNIKTTGGVDVDIEDIINENNLEAFIEVAKEVSRNNNAVVAITGPIDIITDGKKTYLIRNGHANMERITGAGCMLSGLIGAFVGANPENALDSTVLAIGMMGLCGELANKRIIKDDLGTSSFRTFLIDYISKIDEKELMAGLKLEARE